MMRRTHTRVHVHMYTPASHFIACIREEDVTLVCRLLPKFLVIDVILSAEYSHQSYSQKAGCRPREREEESGRCNHRVIRGRLEESMRGASETSGSDQERRRETMNEAEKGTSGRRKRNRETGRKGEMKGTDRKRERRST